MNKISDRQLPENFPAIKVLLQTPLAFVITNPALDDDPIVFVNEAFEQMTGYSASYAVGRNCRFLQGSDTNQADIDKMRLASADDENFTLVLKNYRANGDAFYNELHVANITDDDGDVLYRLGIQREVPSPMGKTSDDVHADVMLQEIQHRVKNHLAMIVSIIRGQARLATKDPKSDYESLARRVSALSLMYDEVHTRGIATKTVNLETYLKRVAGGIRDTIVGPNISLNMDVEPIETTVEFGVHAGLVITELVTNALKHAFVGRDEGAVHIGLNALSDNEVRLDVTDNGVGFDPEATKELTNSFGTRIIQGMLQSTNGEMSVESDADGSRFEIRMQVPPIQRSGTP